MSWLLSVRWRERIDLYAEPNADQILCSADVAAIYPRRARAVCVKRRAFYLAAEVNVLVFQSTDEVDKASPHQHIFNTATRVPAAMFCPGKVEKRCSADISIQFVLTLDHAPPASPKISQFDQA